METKNCLRCPKAVVNEKWQLCASCYSFFMSKRKSRPSLLVADFVKQYPPRSEKVIVLKQPSKGMVVASPKMEHIVGLIRQVSQTNVTVLLTGETGTGKEVLAREIHNTSRRSKGEFVTVDCTSLSEQIVESELFGHERGSFTGAVTQKIGLFESANGGTLFLDEIAELSAVVQSKFLRVLEESKIRRVGDVCYRPIDIRVVAATNQNLDELVAQKKFRSDLFYRLNVFELSIPPLRERSEEILPLIEHFKKGLDKSPEFSNEVLQLLSRYKWPGNIRELRNLIHRCAVLTTDTVNIGHLPERFVSALATG